MPQQHAESESDIVLNSLHVLNEQSTLGRTTAQPPDRPTEGTDAPPPMDDDDDDLQQADILSDRSTETNVDVQVEIGNTELCDPPSTDPRETSVYSVISPSDYESDAEFGDIYTVSQKNKALQYCS